MGAVPITSKQHGDKIKLKMANGLFKEFWVQNPTAPGGVKAIAVDYLSLQFHNDGLSPSNVFDATNNKNIGHYLNNTFFNDFHAETKEMLVNAYWNTGVSENEASRTTQAKVGLLTRSEWSSVKGNTFYGGLIPVLATSEWTLTPVTGTNSGVWLVFSNSGNVDNYQNVGYSFATRPAVVLDPNLLVAADGTVINNQPPTITVTSPTANQTLHENSVLNLAGNASDVNIDDVVTIKYQIDSGTVRNLHSAVSDGTTPIAFTKSLTYKDGVLKDGNTVITGTLDKDMPHTVTMWAEDGKGGSSTPVTRSFFVVPNRPPTITVNPIATQSELINSNVINVTGAVSDLDANDVTLTFSINGGTEQQIYSGPPSSFTFNILLNDLRVGANTVVLKAKDIYDSQATKTLTINKTHNAVPVNKAVARYAIQAPSGSAKSILLWIRRTLGSMAITAEVSFTDINEPENYVPLTETNSAVVNGLREEEYAYQGTTDKEKIILKITYDRTDETVLDTIKQISGVLF